MIKVYNEKSLKEIEELREKGLYNAPFAVQESANGVLIEAPNTKALEEKIANLEEKLKAYEEKEASVESYDDSKLLAKIEELESKLEDSQKTVTELNKDLDALVGGSDE